MERKNQTPPLFPNRTQGDNPIVLRRAQSAEIPALVGLRIQQLIDEGAQPREDITQDLQRYFKQAFESHVLVQWVGDVHDEIVATGAISFYQFPPSFTNASGVKGYIMNMYTRPDYRGRGLATRLLKQLEQEAGARGVQELFLIASAMGRPVYLDFGFEQAEAYLEKRSMIP